MKDNDIGIEIYVFFLVSNAVIFVKLKLRMYCIDRAGVPETNDAHAIHCLYN